MGIQEPMEEPNKQQTASIFSLVLFNWMNETVAKASRVVHLPLEQFPVLSDTNLTKNLVERSIQVRPLQMSAQPL